MSSQNQHCPIRRMASIGFVQECHSIPQQGWGRQSWPPLGSSNVVSLALESRNSPPGDTSPRTVWEDHFSGNQEVLDFWWPTQEVSWQNAMAPTSSLHPLGHIESVLQPSSFRVLCCSQKLVALGSLPEGFWMIPPGHLFVFWVLGCSSPRSVARPDYGETGGLVLGCKTEVFNVHSTPIPPNFQPPQPSNPPAAFGTGEAVDFGSVGLGAFTSAQGLVNALAAIKAENLEGWGWVGGGGWRVFCWVALAGNPGQGIGKPVGPSSSYGFINPVDEQTTGRSTQEDTPTLEKPARTLSVC